MLTSTPTHRVPCEFNERETFWNGNAQYDNRHPFSSSVKPDAKRIGVVCLFLYLGNLQVGLTMRSFYF